MAARASRYLLLADSESVTILVKGEAASAHCRRPFASLFSPPPDGKANRPPDPYRGHLREPLSGEWHLRIACGGLPFAAIAGAAATDREPGIGIKN